MMSILDNPLVLLAIIVTGVVVVGLIDHWRFLRQPLKMDDPTTFYQLSPDDLAYMARVARDIEATAKSTAYTLDDWNRAVAEIGAGVVRPVEPDVMALYIEHRGDE